MMSFSSAAPSWRTLKAFEEQQVGNEDRDYKIIYFVETRTTAPGCNVSGRKKKKGLGGRGDETGELQSLARVQYNYGECVDKIKFAVAFVKAFHVSYVSNQMGFSRTNPGLREMCWIWPRESLSAGCLRHVRQWEVNPLAVR